MFEKLSEQEALDRQKSDGKCGLTTEEAGSRLIRYGKNELREARKKTAAENFLAQLNDPLIYVLIVAAAISILLQEVGDAVIIAVVVFMNALIGVIQEGKARKALESLKKLTSPHAFVIRDGVRREIPAAELTEGDIVLLEAGCQVPADMRLIETVNLKIEESALTGETLPVEKDSRFQVGCAGEIPLGDRRNMAYMSTIVTYGRGVGVVSAVGMNTQIGQIAAMITETGEEMTPLQKRLGELGKVLSLLSLLLCGALFAIAVLQNRNIPEMLITAISLAVAAVPEGLPAVVTICLALSVTKMVKVHTIIRRLPSVETLGAVSVVCSDKTGTLTQNRMTVEMFWCDGGLNCLQDVLRESSRGMPDRNFLQGMVLCNDASIEGGNRIGDPTELALLDMGALFGIHKESLDHTIKRMRELPFDSDRKLMTTYHNNGTSYTKGAPDEILKRCSHIRIQGKSRAMTREDRRRIEEAVSQMSSQALRTLAVAMRECAGEPVERELVFLGVVGMKDPARPEAGKAVEIFKKAGVTTVMITGDHVDTAFAIGSQLGIVEREEQCLTGRQMQELGEEEFLQKLEHTRVFARVSPVQKVRIVKGFQKKGQIVAMTGDGVNDAPSLKAADIGIAMGMAGTDVAKQASDMILTDDNFATIEKAIEEGRGIYENIRKSVIFLLSSNLGEIMTMFFAVLCGLAAPLKSSHILWINLITDSLPALSLGIDYNDGRSLMKNSPRKANESLFSRGGFVCTCFYGALIACASLGAFLMLPCAWIRVQGLPLTIENLSIVLKQDVILSKAQTYAFTVLGMSQLFHAVGMRDVDTSVFRMNHLKNPLMILACVIGFGLQFAVTEVPFLIRAFGTTHLSFREWKILAVLAAFPLFAHEIMVFVKTICQWRKK
ncbi:MAG: cation-translocating P-type ATPase [Lachnoclostridium sp.]|nr:cation-translocating P-type ATPase [Lachnospira sp.]MCM1247474.1 cation-translocating P-type ATPase [Lachnoclostridium sp.]